MSASHCRARRRGCCGKAPKPYSTDYARKVEVRPADRRYLNRDSGNQPKSAPGVDRP